MSTKPKLKKIPLPKGLSKLPKGAVYLGEGPLTTKDNVVFSGWCAIWIGDRWDHGENWKTHGGGYLAAPADSAIAREILGEPAKPVTKRKSAKKTITKPSKAVTKSVKSKKSVTLDLSNESVGAALVAAAHAASFGIEFCESANRLGITLPNWLPALPPVPSGYDRWEPRGAGYCGTYGHYAATSEKAKGRWSFSNGDATYGFDSCFYIEAVRDEKPIVDVDDEAFMKEMDAYMAKSSVKTGISDDLVNHPSHYTQGGVECIDAIQSALSPEEFRGYLRGCAMEYLWRGPHKGNYAQDLAKAKWYLDRLAATIDQEKS